jgi:hypothetical protein
MVIYRTNIGKNETERLARGDGGRIKQSARIGSNGMGHAIVVGPGNFRTGFNGQD